MKRMEAVLALAVILLSACSGARTASVPTARPGATATSETRSPVASPTSGTASSPSADSPAGPPSSEALRTYLRRVHRDVLLEYARSVEANRVLLAQAGSQGDDPAVLCTSSDQGYWLHFDALWLSLAAIDAPPEAATFHSSLLDALSEAEKSSRAYNWFCETYLAFGQPAEGMWTRLGVEVRACLVRMLEVQEMWGLLGGEAMGLGW